MGNVAKQFTSAEWKLIKARLEQDPERFGLPQREYGSVLLGSFNIRKLGSSRSCNQDTWEFLAGICRSFDLLAVQEIMDNLSGMRRLMSLLGPEFTLVVSDLTGVFPGEQGLGERLGFIYRWNTVERMEVASDVTFDRTKVIDSIASNYADFVGVLAPYARRLADYQSGKRKTKPSLKLSVFLSFIRQPFCVSFRIAGRPGTTPYEFMAVNAHLYFGNYIDDRRQEFNALVDWIMARFENQSHAYYPNFLLMGDLNLDYDNPTRDRARIEERIKSLNGGLVEANVNFPFLDVHPGPNEVFRTNARMSETFDQIGFFNKDARLPTYVGNATMGADPRGPDYGVFEFCNLFSEAVLDRPLEELSGTERSDLMARFEHKVSDHMPLWVRLPSPED